MDKSTVPVKIVCYCGSIRFRKTFEKYEYESIFKGEIALMPYYRLGSENEYINTSEYRHGVAEIHRKKIEICSEVFVINEGGYIGESTRREIEYALSLGKPISYMEEINNNKIKEDKVELQSNKLTNILNIGKKHPKCKGFMMPDYGWGNDFDCGYNTIIDCDECKYGGGLKDPAN